MKFYNYLNKSFLILICVLFFLINSSYSEKIIFQGVSLDKKAPDSNAFGYGVAVYIDKIIIKNYDDHVIQISSWVRDKNGNYEGYYDAAEIYVESDDFIYKEKLKIFYYDTYLIDLFGEGAEDLTICIGVYDNGFFDGTGGQKDPIAWKEISIDNTELEDRGKPLLKTEDVKEIEKRGTWNPDKNMDLLEPTMRDQAVKPESNNFFCFAYSLPIYPDHQIKTTAMFYMPDGDKMLVSDDHSTVYLYDINNKKMIWKNEIYKDTFFDIYIDDVRPDGKEFLTTTKLQHTTANPSFNIHSAKDGRLIRQIFEKSLYCESVIDGVPYGFYNDEMIAKSAVYYNEGKDILVIWQNLRMDRGMFDFSLKCYDAYNYNKKWEWQILDPRGLDLRSNGRHIALEILPLKEKYGDFLLFSETGEVRKLTYEIIKKAEKKDNVWDKPVGNLLYTLENKDGYYPKSYAKTNKANEYFITYADNDNYGRLALYDVKTGSFKWTSSYENVFSMITQRNNGRYIFSRSNNYWNIWDKKTKYLIGSGPYFYWSSFGQMAIHPVKREIAFTYWNHIYFLIERPKKTYRVTKDFQRTGIYVNNDTEINAWGDGDIEIALSPDETYSDGETKYLIEDNYRIHAGGPYDFREFYFDRHGGRELYIRSDEASKIDIWGGWSKNEFSKSLKEIRDNLPEW